MLVSVGLVADFSRGCAQPVIAHAFLLTHPTPRFANWLWYTSGQGVNHWSWRWFPLTPVAKALASCDGSSYGSRRTVRLRPRYLCEAAQTTLTLVVRRAGLDGVPRCNRRQAPHT